MNTIDINNKYFTIRVRVRVLRTCSLLITSLHHSRSLNIDLVTTSKCVGVEGMVEVVAEVEASGVATEAAGGDPVVGGAAIVAFRFSVAIPVHSIQ